MRCRVPLATPHCPPGPMRGRVAGGREGGGERGENREKEGNSVSYVVFDLNHVLL